LYSSDHHALPGGSRPVAARQPRTQSSTAAAEAVVTSTVQTNFSAFMNVEYNVQRMTRTPTAAIIVVGDEILSGKFVEENAAYLITQLRELGVAVRRVEYIPDVLDEIAVAVRGAAARYDHVFTSGGVGPTHDDLTMEGVARAFGVGVVRHPVLEAELRKWYGARLEERNLRMADVPDGAEMVPADHPSWPVTRMKNVYILPGVPVIFRRKFDAMKERFRATPFAIRRVFLMAEEGTIAAHLDAVVAGHADVSVGVYPRFEAVDYRVIVTIEGKDAAAVDRAVEDLRGRVATESWVRVE
jgi:molybdenum cofactor synthesis domain-containing protein